MLLYCNAIVLVSGGNVCQRYSTMDVESKLCHCGMTYLLRTNHIQACAEIFCNLFIRDIIVHWVEALWVQKLHHVADSG